ncbi:MAG TPA: hypothetical protein VFV38_27370 [Ktedonobacteraceae bacterium]|nr:hypothetical protein [Ktedonobacteraceae bacterium]
MRNRKRYLVLMVSWLLCFLVFGWIDASLHALWAWWYVNSDFWWGYLWGGELMLLIVGVDRYRKG